MLAWSLPCRYPSRCQSNDPNLIEIDSERVSADGPFFCQTFLPNLWSVEAERCLTTLGSDSGEQQMRPRPAKRSAWFIPDQEVAELN